MKGQQFIGGTKAALIYALEPVWAALAGLLLAGDVLSVPAWIGCGCILAGMVVGRLGEASGKLHRTAGVVKQRE